MAKYIRTARHKRVKEKKDNVEKKVFVDDASIPSNYNETKITLIARDPYWIYAYWEIAPNSFAELKKQISDELDRSTYVLRMYDVTCKDFNGNNANYWFDIDVGGASNWYINLWSDSVTYCAEIGVRTSSGRFLPLSRSNFVTTPRQNPSGRTDTIWMEVKNKEKTRPFVFVESKSQIDDPASVSRANTSLPKSETRKHRKMYLTEDDIKAYYSKSFPLLKLVSRKSRRSLSDKSFSGGFPSLKEGITLDDIIIRNKGQFVKRILLGSSWELIH